MLFAIFLVLIPFSESADCVGRTDGNYEIGCRSYLICNNGHATVHNCPDPPSINTVYNNITHRCDSPDNVGLPCGKRQDCTGKADARYADLFDGCTTYYTCQFGTFFGHNSCTPGLVFDEVLQTCNWPRDVLPPCGTYHPTTASG